MPTIAITGGVASGKTAFRQYLSNSWNAEVFDADAAVTELIDYSEEVRSEMEETFGPAIYRENKLDREQMRSLIFTSPERRNKLESILHPRIQVMWRQRAENCTKTKKNFLIEIPLLFETGGEVFCDFVIVVACLVSTQFKRLTSLRKIEGTIAHEIIRSQFFVEKKIALANQVIWNDGPTALLQEQAYLTANYLVERYG